MSKSEFIIFRVSKDVKSRLELLVEDSEHSSVSNLVRDLIHQELGIEE